MDSRNTCPSERQRLCASCHARAAGGTVDRTNRNGICSVASLMAVGLGGQNVRGQARLCPHEAVPVLVSGGAHLAGMSPVGGYSPHLLNPVAQTGRASTHASRVAAQ